MAIVALDAQSQLQDSARDQPGAVGPAADARADAPAQRVIPEGQLAFGLGCGSNRSALDFLQRLD